MDELSEYTPDVKAYMIDEANAAKYDMSKGEIYKNSLGYMYKVIEDSPHGNTHVKVKFYFSLGTAIREVPKVVLIS